MGLVREVIKEGLNLSKNVIRKGLPLIAAGIIVSCSSGGGNGTSINNPQPIINPPVTNQLTYDYATTTNTVAKEKISSSYGGTIEVKNSDSLAYGTKLDIPNYSLQKNIEIKMSEVNNPPQPPSVNPDEILNFVGAPVDFKPDNTKFDYPSTLKIHYTDEDLSDAGVLGIDENKLRLFHYDKSIGVWSETPIIAIDTDKNEITAEISHFSYYAVFGASAEQPKDLGTPRPGDLLFKTGLLGSDSPSKAWMPGHVGLTTGEKPYPDECIGSDEKKCLASDDVKEFRLYNTIEALKDGVQYSYYNLPNIIETHEEFLEPFNKEDLYMGARKPKRFVLTDEQREKIVEFAESQIGKPYAWEQTAGVAFGMLRGSLVKGPDEFNCVGLVEAAYEYAGVNEGEGLVEFEHEEEADWGWNFPVLTPSEQYNQTRPAKCPDINELIEFIGMEKAGEVLFDDLSREIQEWKTYCGELPEKEVNCLETQPINIGMGVGFAALLDKPYEQSFIAKSSSIPEIRVGIFSSDNSPEMLGENLKLSVVDNEGKTLTTLSQYVEGNYNKGLSFYPNLESIIGSEYKFILEGSGLSKFYLRYSTDNYPCGMASFPVNCIEENECEFEPQPEFDIMFEVKDVDSPSHF